MNRAARPPEKSDTVRRAPAHARLTGLQSSTTPAVSESIAIQAAAGNFAMQRARLAIGRADDPLEDEADRIAGQVMRPADRPLSFTSASTTPASTQLRRKCAACAGEGKCAACEEEEKQTGGGGVLRRKTVEGSTMAVAPASVHATLGAPGRRMDAGVLGFFGARFGRDFSGVEIHDDAQAAASARQVRAEAYTVGNDIVFADGRYEPETERGQRLIAHELGHVVQQQSGLPRLQRYPDGVPPADPAPTAAAPPVNGKARAQIDKALGKDGTANDAKEIQDFAPASELEKVRLIQLLMTDWWVGPTGEAAIERCWGSLSEARFVPFVEANKKLWDDSIDRGAELEELRQYRHLEKEFGDDVVATARGYLDTNAGVVTTEMEKYGVSAPAGAAPAAPTKTQDDELAKLAEVAKTLRDLQLSQERAREVVVGWRVGDAFEADPDAHGKAKFKVLFDPKVKPQIDPDPDPGVPAADHWGHVVPYELLKPAYDDASKSIVELTTRYPSLYALARQEKSGVTGEFADAPDPKVMREKLGNALQLLATDIDETKLKLGKDIDPLDLTPIHAQLYGGAVPAVGARWQTGFRQSVAKAEVSRHKDNQALLDSLLQCGLHFAFLLAPLTGGLTLVVIMTAATVATGLKAYASAEQYETLAKAAKSTPQPGTELVDEKTVDHAKLVADGDAAAFALTALALGGAVAEFVLSAPNATSLAPQTRYLRVANPKLVAEYEQLATSKLPGVVGEVLAAERSTPGRVRLAQLGNEFDQLRAEVGNATDLTATQRARGNLILTEARQLARADFKNLQTKITKRLRADPQLKAIEDQLIAAGDVEDKATGAVRLRTQKASGATDFEPVNIEHRARLSDNPWAAKDAGNLLITDAAQNQQYLEAIRQYGGVWPADEIEDFVIRHQLNRQGVDFRPGSR